MASEGPHRSRLVCCHSLGCHGPKEDSQTKVSAKRFDCRVCICRRYNHLLEKASSDDELSHQVSTRTSRSGDDMLLSLSVRFREPPLIVRVECLSPLPLAVVSRTSVWWAFGSCRVPKMGQQKLELVFDGICECAWLSLNLEASPGARWACHSHSFSPFVAPPTQLLSRSLARLLFSGSYLSKLE